MLLLFGLGRDPHRTAVAPRHVAQLYTAVDARPAVAARHAVQLRMAVDAAEPCQDEDAIKADAEIAFALLDLDGNGSVEQTEFEKYLLTYGYTPPAVAKIFSTLDLDGNGEISLQELRDGLVEYCRCAACEPEFIEQTHAEADALFDAADTNGDGELSPEELRSHLLERGRYTAEAVECIFRSIDANVRRAAVLPFPFSHTLATQTAASQLTCLCSMRASRPTEASRARSCGPASCSTSGSGWRWWPS